MAEVIECTECGAKLKVAALPAPGKKIRCPKCGAAAPVPDLIPSEEVPVVDAVVVPPKPKPKPVQAEAAEHAAQVQEPRRSRPHR